MSFKRGITGLVSTTPGRMILTEENHIGINARTMETNRAANEEPVFGQVDATGVPTAVNEVKTRVAVANIPDKYGNNP
ncbi:MAG: hypothetical protein H7Y86_15310 [Rhizobacter sp.]|nr:hypothetical protein [Ferruginibacter sp.]